MPYLQLICTQHSASNMHIYIYILFKIHASNVIFLRFSRVLFRYCSKPFGEYTILHGVHINNVHFIRYPYDAAVWRKGTRARPLETNKIHIHLYACSVSGVTFFSLSSHSVLRAKVMLLHNCTGHNSANQREI